MIPLVGFVVSIPAKVKTGATIALVGGFVLLTIPLIPLGIAIAAAQYSLKRATSNRDNDI